MKESFYGSEDGNRGLWKSITIYPSSCSGETKSMWELNFHPTISLKCLINKKDEEVWKLTCNFVRIYCAEHNLSSPGFLSAWYLQSD